MKLADYKALGAPRQKSRFTVAPVIDRTVDGRIFASKREAVRYAQLKNELRAGAIRDLELQPEFKVEIAGKPFCRYRADFGYVKNGVRIIEDVKGRGPRGTAADTAFRLRRKAAELFFGIVVTEFVA